MAGLVADYGSDTESDSAASCMEINEQCTETPLPKPKFVTESQKETCKEKSIFINPFVEADKAEKAILEKHVKMISVDVKTVNGKKICWNYRKNRCRFGRNCKYAHDSDLQIDKSLIVPSQTRIKQIDLCKNTTCSKLSLMQKSMIRKKKKSGKSSNIVPSKKNYEIAQ